MAEIIRSFISGVGISVNLFPSKESLNTHPKTGDYFANAGNHLHVALEREAPEIRERGAQMELGLSREEANSH